MKAEPPFGKVDAESFSDFIGYIAAIIKQIGVFMFKTASDIIEAGNGLFGCKHIIRFLLNKA